MQNGMLIVKARGVIAQYLLQEMQGNFKLHDANVEAQKLVLTNKIAIKNDYLLGDPPYKYQNHQLSLLVLIQELFKEGIST
jgi:hypothetical protein